MAKSPETWIAVRIVEAAGSAAEYCGRISSKVLEELKKPGGGAPVLFKLADAFWVDDHGAFTFIGKIKNYGYQDACYFRSDRIARLVELRPDFVRQIVKQRARKEPPAGKKHAAHDERRKYTSIL